MSGLEEFQIAKLQLQRGDIIVLRVRDRLSREAAERIQREAKRAFGDANKIVVLENGTDISVLTGECKS